MHSVLKWFLVAVHINWSKHEPSEIFRTRCHDGRMGTSLGEFKVPPRVTFFVLTPGFDFFHQIYWVGPILGSALATFVYFVVFDMPDKESRKKSKGTPLGFSNLEITP